MVAVTQAAVPVVEASPEAADSQVVEVVVVDSLAEVEAVEAAVDGDKSMVQA